MAITESGPAAAQVAKNIELIRKARQLKQKDVSDRLREAGRPMLPTVVSKVERGERRIDVDDLVAFGRALGVPPVLLLYPLGQDEEVEVLKGQRVPTEAALKWFVGEDRFPSELVPGGEVDAATGLPEYYEVPEEGWREGAAPVLLWRQHAEWLSEWSDAVSVARRKGLSEADERAERARLQGQAEDSLKQLRDVMRMHGLKPPRLPRELAHLEMSPGQ
ncbi:helix-turn-helix transcriptional regulator [Streptomyces sp. NPDC048442]|uniref:helix-turn-helix domain-containing protein n=1 Tax=Streptomyces sp. NPDC048442 TaxID=3154823 RepID=UPI0034455E97